jgi:hypothetical protein
MKREARVPKGVMVWLAALALLAACSGEGPTWTEMAIAELSPAQQAQRERALAARDALKARLLEELGRALERGGAPAAIDVCRERAPALARELAAQHAVSLGRTSEKLRNPTNQPPAWARAAVSAKRGSEFVLRGPEGELGLLDPLRIAPLCVLCHGVEEQIDPLVRAKLRQRYPEDRATGYALEQLRGYVWVEVPPAR